MSLPQSVATERLTTLQRLLIVSLLEEAKSAQTSPETPRPGCGGWQAEKSPITEWKGPIGYEKSYMSV